MAARPAVMVQGRDLLGKKVGRLRSQGIVPVNLVIPGDDSQALQTDERELVGVLKQTGQSGLVELNSRGATEVALIGDVQVHPVSRRVLHVAFRRNRPDKASRSDGGYRVRGCFAGVGGGRQIRRSRAAGAGGPLPARRYTAVDRGGCQQSRPGGRRCSHRFNSQPGGR